MMWKDERILSTVVILFLLIASLAVPGTVLAIEDDTNNDMIAPLPDLETSGVIRIDSDAELAAVSDSGSGTLVDPYVIENKRIDASGQGAGIYVRNTTKALTIRNCWVSNAVYVDPNWGPGANIMVYSGGLCVIENNRCDNNSGDGIKLALTNSRVSGNTVWGTQNGINVVGSTGCSIDNNTITGTSWTGISVIMQSEYNIVANNTISNCNHGIYLYAQGNHNLVRDNLLTGGETGIFASYGNSNDIRENNISSASHGIEISDSTGNLVQNNKLVSNTFHVFFRRASDNVVTNNTCLLGASSLYMYDAPCYNNTVSWNLFEGSSNFGILMAPSGSGVHTNNRVTNNTFLKAYSQGVYIIPDSNNDNLFFNNAFIGCNGGTGQAVDFSYNYWNNATSGNYWHDHRTPDVDNDGIVDVPYTITSNHAAYDNLPLSSTLRITEPNDMMTTDSDSVTLSGTLINPYHITTFTWHNAASNVTGDCFGDQFWTAEVPLVSGENEITVTMTDDEGRTFGDNVTVLNTAPTLTVDPEEGSTTYTSAGKFNITVDAAGYPGLADIYVVLKADYLGFGYRLGADPVGAETYHGTFELDLYDGLNRVSVFVNDTAGHMAMCSLGLFRDSYPPAIEFTYLPEGSYLNDDPVEITWTFVQEPPMIPDSPIAECYYSMDGSDWTRTYNGSVVFPGLTDGGHFFQIKGVDVAGNVGVNGVNFTLDTVNPYLKITSPFDGALFPENDVDVDFIADDSLTALEYIQYRMDNGDWTDVPGDNITLTDLPDGDHLLEMRTADKAGNLNSTSVTFTVDTAAPVVTITSPEEDGFINSGLVTWTVVDATVNLTEVSTDGLVWTAITGTSHDFTLADGTYTVYVRVTDRLGRLGTDNVTFTLDTMDPALTILSPGDGTYNNTGSVILTWSAEDANQIARTEISVGGSAWTTVSGNRATVSSLNDGLNAIYVRVTDKAGNVKAAYVTVGVSVSGPSVRLLPEETVYTRDGSIELTGTVSDTIPLVSAVLRIYVNGVLVNETDMSSEVEGDMTALLRRTVGLAEGVNLIQLMVNDSAGSSATVDVTVVRDTVAPTLIIVSPAEGALLNVSTGIAHWTASDNLNGSGLNNTWVKVDLGSWIELGSADGWIFSQLGDGEHTLYVKVDDQAGNSVIRSVAFVIDTIAPTAEVSPTGDNQEIDSVVRIEFSETMNITSVIVSVAGVNGTVAWDGDTLTFTPAALENAKEYAVTVSGRDLAGNAMEMNWTFTTETATGSITGTLVDEDGNPLANITVRVGDVSALTDQLGRFILNGLIPASYVLTVDADGFEMYSGTVTVTAGQAEELGELTLVAVNEGDEDDGGISTMLIVAAMAIIAVVAIAAVVFLRRRS